MMEMQWATRVVLTQEAKITCPNLVMKFNMISFTFTSCCINYFLFPATYIRSNGDCLFYIEIDNRKKQDIIMEKKVSL